MIIIPIIAANDSEMYDWLTNASDPARGAGSFVRAIANAAQCADSENYALLRPALLQLKEKYPEYAEPKWLRGNGAGRGVVEG